MKKRLVAAAIAAMLCTATAHAQWVVIDPTNLVQNTLTAIRTLEQINNQIQQLQNEAQMLMNRAQPRQCRQRGRPVARQSGDHAAADRARGLRRDESGSSFSACIPSSTPPR